MTKIHELFNQLNQEDQQKYIERMSALKQYENNPLYIDLLRKEATNFDAESTMHKLYEEVATVNEQIQNNALHIPDDKSTHNMKLLIPTSMGSVLLLVSLYLMYKSGKKSKPRRA